MRLFMRLLRPGGSVRAAAVTARPPRTIPPRAPALGLYATVSGGRALPSYEAQRDHTPPRAALQAHAPEVDFRAMLNNDDQAWSIKTRLQRVLGRPYLATKLVEKLDPATAAMLADRLETLVTTAVEDAVTRLTRDLDIAVDVKLDEIRQERIAKAKELSRERFGRPTRLN